MAISDRRVVWLGLAGLLFAGSAPWFLMGHPAIALLYVLVGIAMLAATAKARPQGDAPGPSPVQE